MLAVFPCFAMFYATFCLLSSINVSQHAWSRKLKSGATGSKWQTTLPTPCPARVPPGGQTSLNVTVPKFDLVLANKLQTVANRRGWNFVTFFWQWVLNKMNRLSIHSKHEHQPLPDGFKKRNPITNVARIAMPACGDSKEPWGGIHTSESSLWKTVELDGSALLA